MWFADCVSDCISLSRYILSNHASPQFGFLSDAQLSMRGGARLAQGFLDVAGVHPRTKDSQSAVWKVRRGTLHSCVQVNVSVKTYIADKGIARIASEATGALCRHAPRVIDLRRIQVSAKPVFCANESSAGLRKRAASSAKPVLQLVSYPASSLNRRLQMLIQYHGSVKIHHSS